jgi:hypothetical protein
MIGVAVDVEGRKVVLGVRHHLVHPEDGDAAVGPGDRQPGPGP